MSRVIAALMAVLMVTAFAGPVAAQPGDLRAYELSFAKGVAAFNQGRYDDAEKQFDQALAAKPDDADARYYRGQTLLRLRRFGDAEQAFRALVEQGAARARVGLGIALYYEGRYRDGLGTLQTAERELPD